MDSDTGKMTGREKGGLVSYASAVTRFRKKLGA
jgi:hypothetical protein